MLKWIVVCDQPYTEPQQQSFIDMIKTLNPEAQTISDKTVHADLMTTFEIKFMQMKNEVNAVPGKISITLDLWTSKNFLSFMAIRGHWLDDDWTYQTKLLDFLYVPDDHSGENLSKILDECLSRYGIPYSKILGITLDNAPSNNTLFEFLMAMTDDLSEDTCHIRCLAHIINLVAQDILALLKVPEQKTDEFDYENEDLDDIDLNEPIDDLDDDEEDDDEDDDDDHRNVAKEKTIIVKLRGLIKKIRKSVKLRQKLKKLCTIYGIKYLVPIIDVLTRWNSSYYMIQRAEYLAVPLRNLFLNEKALKSGAISDSYWIVLADIQSILKKFERATKLVSMQRHCNIPSYLPTFNWLAESLKEYITTHSGSLKRAAEAGLLKLRKYDIDINYSKLPFVATFLNPACKMTYFKEHYTTTEAREIRKQISDYFTEKYDKPTAVAVQRTKRRIDDDSDQDSDTDDELYAHMFKRSKVEKLSTEFQKYIALPLSNQKVDPIQFWKSQVDEFPKMSSMARDFLPLQCGSVSVERDFSGAVDLITPTRCAMHHKTIRANMCLKSWMK